MSVHMPRVGGERLAIELKLVREAAGLNTSCAAVPPATTPLLESLGGSAPAWPVTDHDLGEGHGRGAHGPGLSRDRLAALPPSRRMAVDKLQLAFDPEACSLVRCNVGYLPGAM